MRWISPTGARRRRCLQLRMWTSYLPKQWCGLKRDAKNMSVIATTKKYACKHRDCLSLGSRCSSLDEGAKHQMCSICTTRLKTRLKEAAISMALRPSRPTRMATVVLWPRLLLLPPLAPARDGSPGSSNSPSSGP